MVTGMPCNLPSSPPRFKAASASRAAAKAPLSSSWQTAFNFGFTAAIRSRCARTSSSDEMVLERMRRASSEAERKIRSFFVANGLSGAFSAARVIEGAIFADKIMASPRVVAWRRKYLREVLEVD